MELPWPMKLRIAAVAALGVLLLGIWAWPIAAPIDPFGPVRAANVSLGGAISLVLLAISTSLIAYFISWPFGREIAVFAVPCGLSIWAFRSGSMSHLMKLYPTLHDRQVFFTALKWEPFFWLFIVFVGFAGVFLAKKFLSKPEIQEPPANSNHKPNIYLNAIIALVISVVLVQVCISILARGAILNDRRFGSLVAQPTIGQIFFAVSISFGIAGFIVKKFLNASYLWPIIAIILVTFFNVSTYAKNEVLQYFIERYPTTFFSQTALSILPVQMVAFGSLGSIIGWWLAASSNYDQKPVNKEQK